MLKRLLSATAILVLLGSCTSLKPLGFTNSRQASAPVNDTKEVKFLDNISATTPTDAPREVKESKEEGHLSGIQSMNIVPSSVNLPAIPASIGVEKASSLQIKYALLMNTEVEQVQNIPLYENIDQWYGTRYKLGGTTKRGIDCSALVQTIFISAFGVTLPRTARDQYRVTRRISCTELQEGDLLFFNTRGGVSHVGIYLQNNKFVHASVSGGVMISDMFDPYYVRKFIGAGRIEKSYSAIVP